VEEAMNSKVSFTIIAVSLIVSVVFFGLQMRPWQVEASHTTCIWPYTSGDLDIEYRWGNNLSGPSAWKTAFSTSLSDWNATSTAVNFQHDAYAVNSLNTYNLEDGQTGVNQPYCADPGGELVMNDTYGNVYYDIQMSYTANERRSVTGHELGHVIGLEHGSSNELMYGVKPSSTIYVPQSGDVSEVNAHY
jgi:predicted Zn-dependent protease